MKPTKHKFTILKQVIDIIPPYIVSKIARKHGVDKRSRSFSPWSHVVSMIYAQLSHALSLNDICDTLRHHASTLFTLRNATPPSRNGLSHANKVRSSHMAEELFWEVLSHLKQLSPRFERTSPQFKIPRKFKRLINLVDSTTIQLFANCMSWAKHRRRKAAAKCHMCLDALSFLPRFVVIKTAKSSDAVTAHRLCANILDGEIVVFDKAYVDFKHLYALMFRGVFWITRAKSNMSYKVVKRFKHKNKNKSIILDAKIKLKGTKSAKDYPGTFRLIIADVKRDGKIVRMEFITNNFSWASSSIGDLYKARWQIELFFKQLKQTLKLADFLGYSENAVQWQIWMALLAYIILRFIAFTSKWRGSFARLFTTIRGVMWNRFDLCEILKFCCGTAKKPPRVCAQPQQLYLPFLVD
ncbi:MAG: IS4 family transposase [Candidatus Peribacteraceae bacterium]|nr:IS4 family transposase [Candidatus Peribacteraceae bacterium]